MRVVNNNNKRFHLLDAFRGIAIFWIVSFHVLPKFNLKIIDLVVTNGNLGVYIFLIISGYGISRSLEKVKRSNSYAGDFLKRRLERIYVPYIFSLFLIVFLIHPLLDIGLTFKGHPFQLRMMNYKFIDMIEIITLVKVFFSTSWHLADAFSEFNGVAWYLAITVQIYLIVGVALYFKSYFYQVISFVTLLSVICMIPGIKAKIPYGLFFPLWLYFFMGILLFHSINKGFFIPFKTIKGYALFVLLAYLAVAGLILYYLFSPGLFSLLFVIFLWLTFSIDNDLSNNKLSGFFLFIASFSYSIFLLHIPLSQLISPVLKTLGVSQSAISFSLVLIPLIGAISYLWYLFFEKPVSFSRSLTAILNPIKTIRPAREHR